METSNIDPKVYSLLESLYKKVTENVYKVYSVIVEHFGEDKVDFSLSKDIFINTILESSIGYLNNYIDSENLPYSEYYFKDLTVTQQEEVLNLLIKTGNIDILGVFNLQITIYYPEVTITNEYNESIDIYDTYVRFYINYYGNFIGYEGITMNRTTYTENQWNSKYIHSHARSLDRDSIGRFMPCCLGTGPINNTIEYLLRNNDEDHWGLFCIELDNYIRTESVSGGPYIKMSSVNSFTRGLSDIFEKNEFVYVNKRGDMFLLIPGCLDANLHLTYLKEFIKYILNSKKLKFKYVNNSYTIGMSYTEFMLTISDLFIDWVNKNNGTLFNTDLSSLLDNSVLHKRIIRNNTIYPKIYSTSHNNIEGSPVLDFKGETKYLKIIKNDDNQDLLILDGRIAMQILTCILNVLNYKYGKSVEESQTDKEVWYL